MFTSIGPCDACLSGKVEAASHLSVKVLGVTDQHWPVLRVVLQVDGAIYPLGQLVYADERFASLVCALVGDTPSSAVLPDVFAAARRGWLQGMEGELPRNWFEPQTILAAAGL
jgi:hypothetical protein